MVNMGLVEARWRLMYVNVAKPTVFFETLIPKMARHVLRERERERERGPS